MFSSHANASRHGGRLSKSRHHSGHSTSLDDDGDVFNVKISEKSFLEPSRGVDKTADADDGDIFALKDFNMRLIQQQQLAEIMLTEDGDDDERKEPREEPEEEEEERIPDWIRCSPADLYFRRSKEVCSNLIIFLLISAIGIVYFLLLIC